MARAVLVVLIAAAAGHGPAPAAAAGAPSPDSAARASTPLLLEVQLQQVPLDAVLEVQDRGDEVLLPLGELCRVLEVAIDVDAAKGVASGFFATEAHPFHLDVAAREVRCGRRTFAWDSTRIVPAPDDIYVSAGVLASWFDLTLSVRRQDAVLAVRSATPLPLEARAERARRVQRNLLAVDAGGSGFRRIATPYRLWSTPFIDQELRTWSQAGGGRRSTQWQSATYAAGDLLFLESDLFVRADRRNPLAEVHGGMGRRDPEAGLLGPLRARQFRIGQVGYPGLALIAPPAAAPGILVSNYPLERPSQFRSHTFSGRLPDGWDVELYRDGSLIGYQVSQADGTYRFEGVPLTFGLNEFRLVFNGPHGERHDQRRVFNIGPSLVPPGAVHYRLVASGVADTSLRAHLETDFHLAGSLSASLALATARSERRAHYYATGGVRGFWRHLFADAGVAVDSAGGRVAELALETRTRRFGAGVRRADLWRGFQSEIFRSPYGGLESRTGGFVDVALTARPRLRVPVQLELTSDDLGANGSVRTWTHRMGVSLRRVSLSHEWRESRTHGFGGGRDVQQGLLVSVRMRDWSLRGGIDRAPAAADRWRDAHLTAEGPAFRSVYAAVGLARDQLAGNTLVGADLRCDRGLFGWSARAELGTRSPLSMSVALSIGLDHEPRHGDWHANARALAGTGAASAQVFLDVNGNGARDPGEEPLPGVRLAVNHAETSGPTDERGVLFVGGLPGEQDAELELVSDTLDDPLWVAREPGVRVAARPGRTTLVDFPVVVSGEVAGTVTATRDGATHPAAGVTLELVDAATGSVVKRTATAYDGYFDLLAVPPGRYELRLAGSQLRRFGLEQSPRRAIEIAPSGTLLEGIGLTIAPPDSAGPR